jgi:hypothetical protein
MTLFLFTNNAGSTLAATANIADTSIVLATGEGARFPSPGAGEKFHATIQNGTAFEIVEVTGRTGDTLAVVRAREGTSAQTWNVGSSVTLRVTAGVLTGMEQRTRAQAEYAAINGPISLSADPADPTHAVRESYLAGRETAIRTDLGADILARGRLVGEMVEYYGLSPPARFLFADGSERFRSVFSELFNAITRELTVTVASGSPTVTVTAGSLTHVVAGMPISLNLYFPAGTTIVSVGSGTLTLSANALASDSNLALRVCPYGAGNDTTTFNLPDRRGRVAVTRAGTSGRITTAGSGVDGLRFGAVGGDQNLQQHLHGVTQTPHGHGVSDPGHVHGNENLHMTPFVGIGFATYTGGGAGVLYYSPNGTLPSGTGISIQGANANITIQNAGTGGSGNVQPCIVCNHIIFTNVP